MRGALSSRLCVFFSSRRRHTRLQGDWSSDVCSSDLAVFAPVQRLAAIVVDEEHEASYKQGTAPRYHARDVALARARLEGPRGILGSATPSREKLHLARTRRGRPLRLPEPIGARPRPPG